MRRLCRGLSPEHASSPACSLSPGPEVPAPAAARGGLYPAPPPASTHMRPTSTGLACVPSVAFSLTTCLLGHCLSIPPPLLIVTWLLGCQDTGLCHVGWGGLHAGLVSAPGDPLCAVSNIFSLNSIRWQGMVKFCDKVFLK